MDLKLTNRTHSLSRKEKHGLGDRNGNGKLILC
jgi:hypothetical protein